MYVGDNAGDEKRKGLRNSSKPLILFGSKGRI
jgi:hypothetical protein